MKKSVFPLLKIFLLLIFLCLMLLFPSFATEGAKNGLLLWYRSVVPALFPFMVLSGLIVSGGGISILTAPFHLFLGPLLGVSRPGTYVLISGLLCGYPMGAKTCGDFLREGRIGLSEGRFLMALCNHPSPMFLLGFVFPLFAGQLSLPAFLFSVYGPLLFLAPLSSFFYARRKGDRTSSSSAFTPARPLTGDETILNAIEILCKIGGYLMLFSIAVVFLKNTSLPPAVRMILIGSMEMTTGVREAAQSLPFPLSGAAACAILTFGGFSGLAQTNSVICGEKSAGLSIRHYFFWKLLHGALSFLLFLLCASFKTGGFLPSSF